MPRQKWISRYRASPKTTRREIKTRNTSAVGTAEFSPTRFKRASEMEGGRRAFNIAYYTIFFVIFFRLFLIRRLPSNLDVMSCVAINFVYLIFLVCLSNIFRCRRYTLRLRQVAQAQVSDPARPEHILHTQFIWCLIFHAANRMESNHIWLWASGCQSHICEQIQTNQCKTNK